MALQLIQSRISSLQREIESLQKRLASKSREELSSRKRIEQIRRSVSKTTSSSSLGSKMSYIRRLEGDLLRIEEYKANLSRQIADKTAKLNDCQQQLYKAHDNEQERLRQNLLQQQKENKRQQEQLLAQLRTDVSAPDNEFIVDGTKVAYDAFISHASEDKDELVRPLAEKLREQGYAVWYDEFELTVGDSLRRSIDKGLARSRFGIVVLSPSFFAKNWPQYELDGLVAKEMAGRKVILPLWHKVSKDQVMSYSPTLADRVALNTMTYTIAELAQELGKALEEANTDL